MNRGRRGAKIFAGQEDMQSFLSLLKKSIELFHVKIGAYCLMTNHYHILIQTPLGNLPRAMRHINGVHTQRFNRRHGFDGTLFRGRYKSILIDVDGYLVDVVKYIHQNPMKAGMEKHVGRYPWTSHQGYLSQAKRWSWLTREPVLSLIAGIKKNKRRAYLEFMNETLSQEVDRFYGRKNLRSVLGSPSFVQWIRDKYSDAVHNEEVFPAERVTLPIEDVVFAVCRQYEIQPEDLQVKRRGRRNEARKVAIFLARKHTGEPLLRIAGHFGLGRHSSVGSAVIALEAEMGLDKALRRRVDAAEKTLKRQKST
jgi:REP element-mobilizing transposase RayT